MKGVFILKDYKFPCYPGDEVWYFESYGGKPLMLRKDIVQMVRFTTRSVQIKLRGCNSFNKTFTWGKNVFDNYDEALIMFAKKRDRKVD